MNKRAIGSEYEKRAAAYLEQCGMCILEYNYRIRSGEIDLIARDGRYLVFVEVKYRANSHLGTPLEAVDARKQKTIVRTAQCYLLQHGYSAETPCRFDVIGIDGEQITHVKDAFWGG
ncbi:YraN family protein [Marvinbryantia formatexigens]|uniref:YraN family protein n=1 Tax=Marvinbryantia formatexigens TaxID=168384 RepID=UPI0002E5BFD7|nr:YraN family protein [Marvinbryantia formatexigens]UWO24494.1 YraN family protein [Marvinbryantia formatexigens DSM 14469]SDF10370.1 putative endonuclease [Marvinbryantia formatexigens]